MIFGHQDIVFRPSMYTRNLKACMKAELMKLYDSPVYTTQNACKSESC